MALIGCEGKWRPSRDKPWRLLMDQLKAAAVALMANEQLQTVNQVEISHSNGWNGRCLHWSSRKSGKKWDPPETKGRFILTPAAPPLSKHNRKQPLRSSRQSCVFGWTSVVWEKKKKSNGLPSLFVCQCGKTWEWI